MVQWLLMWIRGLRFMLSDRTTQGIYGVQWCQLEQYDDENDTKARVELDKRLSADGVVAGEYRGPEETQRYVVPGKCKSTECEFPNVAHWYSFLYAGDLAHE